jgi:sugar phosphate permease
MPIVRVRDIRDLRSQWSYSYTVLLLCWFGWIAIYLCRSILAPILPVLSEELGLSHAQGGMLETAYLAGYIVIKMPAGAIANRIGIKRTLVTASASRGHSSSGWWATPPPPP